LRKANAEAGISDEAWERFNELIEKYDDAIDKAHEYSEAIEENNLELRSLAVEKIQYKLELHTKIEERELEWLDYQLGKLEDRTFAQAEKIVLLGQQMTSYSNSVDAAKKSLEELGLGELFTNPDADITALMTGKSFTEEEISVIEEAYGTIMTNLNNMSSLEQQSHEIVLSYFSDLEESRDKVLAATDRVMSTTNSYKNIVSLLGQDALGEGMYEFMDDLNEVVTYSL
jgi:hypothetical protein